ncbi:MAG: nicotinate-nucleotide--dimethylbenzimidazole phosphoribosyltransferase [Thiohalomonadaceae bacterium]
MIELEWLGAPCADMNESARRDAEARQRVLTKPLGALGELEHAAIRLAALQGTACPGVDKVHVAVFAGDHGVAARGVSAFPQSVTLEMVRNFVRGGAAISVVARALHASLEVINLGTVHDAEVPGVMACRLGPGTADLSTAPAMTAAQLAGALNAGRESVVRAARGGAQLYIGGEMGIGNTTSASALACALLGAEPRRLTGPGTGINGAGVAHKVAIIEEALAFHRAHLQSPEEILRRLGGFEIAALAGAFIACAQEGIPVLVDGFITTAALLAAERLRPGVRDWCLFSHRSAEPGHGFLLDSLDARPLLAMGMRLGEGSGAAVTVPLLRLACALHNEMATFADAGVSDKAG